MKDLLRILFVEDSENDALIALRHLEKGGCRVEYEVVQTAEGFKESLQRKAWDLVLCDYQMPRFNGFEALRIFRESGPDIPFIIISGTIGEEIAVECMRAGADDYLMKGRLTRLLPAVERALREAENRSERKRLEKERRRAESELRFRNIILSTQQEVSIDGILVVDEDGRMLSFNRNFIDMWGIPQEAIDSKSDERALQWVLGKLAEPEEYLRKVKYLYEHRTETSRDEFALIDGRTFDRYSAPMIGPEGKYYGRVWFFRDITERKRAEEEIKRTEAKRFELERELMQSQKMESLGTLASGIAHDFNNILAVISGYSEMGGKKSLPHRPELAKYFETISLASRRGALLVSRLLTFARKTEAVFRPVDINALIAELTLFFAETFPKTVSISTDLQEDIPRIVADPSQLHQVFLNLCVNARDAMPAGGAISISTRVLDEAAVRSRFPRAPARRHLEIRVSDSGSGMDEKTKGKIFDPFFTTKGPDKGTGLGLSLVHSIIGSHHGTIEVESEPGKGTSFLILLPIEESGAEREEPEKEFPAARSEGTGTVLLIEDEAEIIELARSVLGGEGFTLLVARDGEEGLALFSRHRKEISAVISDVGLPKIRGDEVAARIKAIDPGARILLISGFFDPWIRTGMAGIGVNHLLQKPFSFRELVQNLRSVLEAGPAPAPPGPPGGGKTDPSLAEAKPT